MDDKYSDALQKWTKSCEEYEEEATKKTAKKFNITIKEVDDTYCHYVLEDYQN